MKIRLFKVADVVCKKYWTISLVRGETVLQEKIVEISSATLSEIATQAVFNRWTGHEIALRIFYVDEVTSMIENAIVDENDD